MPNFQAQKRTHFDTYEISDESDSEEPEPKKCCSDPSNSPLNSLQQHFYSFFGWIKKEKHISRIFRAAMSALKGQEDDVEAVGNVTLRNYHLRGTDLTHSKISEKPSVTCVSPFQQRSKENFPFLASDLLGSNSHKYGATSKTERSKYGTQFLHPAFSSDEAKSRMELNTSGRHLKTNNSYTSDQQQTMGSHSSAHLSNFFPKWDYPISESTPMHGRQPAAFQENWSKTFNTDYFSDPPDRTRNGLSYVKSKNKTHLDDFGSKESLNMSQMNETKQKKLNFTANEVIRYDEKEKYQLLLKRYYKGGKFHTNVSRPSNVNNSAKKPLSSSVVKEVVDLTEEECLMAYTKPCTLVRQSALKKAAKQPILEVTLDDDDDSDSEPEVLHEKLKSNVEFPTSKMIKSAILSSDWIKDLKEKLEEEKCERLKIEEFQEKRIKEFKEQRAVKIAKMKLQRLKALEKNRIEIPVLTPEMNEVINRALNPGYDQHEILSQLNSCKLTRRDADTLGGLNWLNDEVINFYMELIVERSKTGKYPAVHACSTFFYSTLRRKGYSAVRRWTRHVDIFSKDIILIPLHFGVHWCLGVIDFRLKTIKFYDSMGGSDDHFLDLMSDYLVNEYEDKKKNTFDISGWTKEIVHNIPHQMNGSDCGMFALKYAESITRDVKITFTQENMAYFRRRMIYEIIAKQLL